MTLEEYIKKHSPSMVTKELIRKLQQFSKEDDAERHYGWV